MRKLNSCIFSSERVLKKSTLIAYFVSPLVVVYCFFAVTSSFLYFSWETRSLSEIADSLILHKGYYASGLRKTQSELKFALLEELKPEVVVLGSSHVLQIRGEYFNRSFLNMGSTMQSLSDGINVVTRLVENDNRPRVVILGLDYYWFFGDDSQIGNFNDAWLDLDKGRFFTLEKREKSGFRIPSFYDLKRLTRYLVSSDGNFESLKRSITNPGVFMGLDAIFRNNGFDKFGKYHYNYRLFSPLGRDNKSFVKGDGGLGHYERLAIKNKTIDEFKWAEFLHLRRLVNRRGLKLITFIVPTSNWATEEIQESGLGSFLLRLENRLNSLGTSNYSYWSQFNENCEFVDEGHPGEITMARILLDLVSQEEVLEEYLEEDLLNHYIEKYSGMVTIRELNYLSGSEINFNQLDCPGRKLVL